MPAFLAPWFLLAGLAAAIPVAVHLLHRRKPEPVPFSTVRFLREAVAETRRSRHLTHVSVLLMRMLIVLLLAAAFARPTIRTSRLLPGANRVVILVIDASASMRCRQTGGETSFDRAVAWASDVLGDLNPGDRAALVVPGRPDPFELFPPASNLAHVQTVLHETDCGWGEAQCAGCLRDLVRRLSSQGIGVDPEIHVFSDFQPEDWPRKTLRSLADDFDKRRAAVFLNRITPVRPANAGIRRVILQPRVLTGTGRLRAIATLGADSGFSGGNTLVLSRDGREVARSGIVMDAGETVDEALETTDTGSEPFFRGTLQLAPDAYPPDNSYHLALPRMNSVPLLLVDGGTPREGGMDSFYVEHALRPGGGASTLFDPTVLGWERFLSHPLASYRAVLVCNPPIVDDTVLVRLEQVAERGGVVVIFPGDHQTVARNLSRFPSFEGSEIERDTRQNPQTARLLETDHPTAVERRTAGLLSDSASFALRTRLRFSRLPSTAQEVFRYEGGAPFAVRTALGAGSLWALSVSAGREWFQWRLALHFVVFVHELLRFELQPARNPFTIAVGSPLILPPFGQRTTIDVDVESPAGKRRTKTTTRSGPDAPFRLAGLTVPGHWRIRAGEKRWTAAVNIPASERRLSFVDSAALMAPLEGCTAHAADTPEQLRGQIETLRRGRPLWPILLILAFVLAVAEELVANWRSSTHSILRILGAMRHPDMPHGNPTEQ